MKRETLSLIVVSGKVVNASNHAACHSAPRGLRLTQADKQAVGRLTFKNNKQGTICHATARFHTSKRNDRNLADGNALRVILGGTAQDKRMARYMSRLSEGKPLPQ